MFQLQREQLLFDFAREGLEACAQELLDLYIEEARKRAKSLNWVIEPTMFPAGRRILGTDRLLQAAVLTVALARLLPGAFRRSCDSTAIPTLLRKLVSRIAQRRLPLSPEQTNELVTLLADHALHFTYTIPVLGLLRVVQQHVELCGITDGLKSGLCRLQSVWLYDWYFNRLHKIQHRVAIIQEVGQGPS